ncbi:MAG: rubrerythrin family protein [Clostridiaceae bacterium]|jgi:rubrerythrin|nr:rubrerythrin family protein [Clostridiaceae bacterium]
MTDFDTSQTRQQLINSFAGESMARNRYTFFSKIAKNEGYEQISGIFLETADNEKEHAKLFYKFIGNTSAQVDGFYPFEYGNTMENLLSAIAGEKEESDILYYNGEQIAKEEGFFEIEKTFKDIRHVEMHHMQRYSKLLENIKNNTVFKKEKEELWICRNCGYIVKGALAPEKCPCCSHPQSYFQILCENF